MKRRLLIALLVLLVAAGGYCAYRYINDSYLPKKQLEADIKKAQELNDRIRPKIASDSAAPDADGSPRENRLEAAQLLDDGVAAWITIPDTTIDYPVVRGDDNTYYLDHTLDGEYNQQGTPFLDCRCDRDFKGFNSIVYGHHFYSDDSVVFGTLYYYKDPAYMTSHPMAQLILPYEIHNVKLFAYMNVGSTSKAYSVNFDTKEEREDYLDYIYSSASYTTVDRSELDADSRLLLLSTCTGEYWEARGVLVGLIE